MAKEYQIIRDELHKVGRVYIKALQQELEFQKHIASGDLAESFFTRVHKARGSLILDIMNNTPYMWIVNNGSNPTGTFSRSIKSFGLTEENLSPYKSRSTSLPMVPSLLVDSLK